MIWRCGIGLLEVAPVERPTPGDAEGGTRAECRFGNCESEDYVNCIAGDNGGGDYELGSSVQAKAVSVGGVAEVMDVSFVGFAGPEGRGDQVFV